MFEGLRRKVLRKQAPSKDVSDPRDCSCCAAGQEQLNVLNECSRGNFITYGSFAGQLHLRKVSLASEVQPPVANGTWNLGS